MLALERSYKVRNETHDATGFMDERLFDGTKATSEEVHGPEVVPLDPVDEVVQFDHWSKKEKEKCFLPMIDRVASETTTSCPVADHQVVKLSNEDTPIVLATIQRGQDECKDREHSRFQRGWDKRSTQWINVLACAWVGRAARLECTSTHFQHVRTRDFLDYFQGYGPSYVECINDSSCTIVFQDDYTSMRTLVALGHEIPSNDVDMEEGDATQGPDNRNEDPPNDEKQDHDAAFDRSH
ncbi:hypothetical protein PsorP6_008304 [Peronosclerospora sorghi]|uniref:Uncharacterized protein n=1 Tax=Peronosclerospora sorghi TaxID=230839 RepID=A0ACC0WA81_9STRA|nr:hypothetical protein PsorP6_008304 [Peronosclerospora sorghi]